MESEVYQIIHSDHVKTLANNLRLYFWKMSFLTVVKFEKQNVIIMTTIFWVITFCKCFILTENTILLYAIYEDLNGYFQKDLIHLVTKVLGLYKNLWKRKRWWFKRHYGWFKSWQIFFSLLPILVPMSHFYTPWKRQKTYGFRTFSGRYRNVTLD